MKVKIGVAESNRVVEIEVDDASAFEKTMEDAYDSGKGLIWFEDTKRRRVGIPKERIAFIEIDTDQDRVVGFG